MKLPLCVLSFTLALALSAFGAEKPAPPKGDKPAYSQTAEKKNPAKSKPASPGSPAAPAAQKENKPGSANLQPAAKPQPAASSAPSVPKDSSPIFTNQRLASGMPLGGIGTGKIELFTDGRFGNLTLNNNFHQPIENPPGCFAAVRVSGATGAIAKGLYWQKSESHGVQSTQMQGVYPTATVTFEDAELPISVRLRAFSPQVPGNEKDSSVPGVVFLYTVKNKTAADLDVSLAMSWENRIGQGGTAERIFETTGECAQTFVQKGDWAGILYQFKGEPAEPRARNALGEYALFALKEKKDRCAALTSWKTDQAEEDFWQPFREQGEFPAPGKKTDTHPDSDAQRPAAAVSVKRRVPANAESTFVFVFSWYMPHLIASDGSDYGMFYANAWDSAVAVATDLGNRRESLLRGMEEFRRPFYDSSLPSWLVDRLFNRLSALSSSSVLLKDGRFCAFTGEENYRGNIGSPEEQLLASLFFLQFYPRLLESQIRLWMDSQLATGEVPSAAGNLYAFVGKGEAPGGFLNRPDSTCAFVLLALHYYLWTGDEGFLQEVAPHARAAILWLMGKDANGDGIPDGASMRKNEGDRAISLFTGDLWLAVLRMADDFGSMLGDLEFQSHCRTLRAQAAQNLARQLWNGQYFNPYFRSDRPLDNESDRLTPSALTGEWFAAVQGWRPLLDADLVWRSFAVMAESVYPYDPVKDFRQATENSKIPDSHSLALSGGFTDAAYAASLIRFGYPNAALAYLRKSETASVTSYHDPWNLPLLDQKSETPGLSALGAWSILTGLTGFGLDMRLKCLIVGPQPPIGMNDFNAPFFSPLYDGRLEYHHSEASGQSVCRLRFTHVIENKELALKQIAFHLPEGIDAGKQLVRVLHNGEYLPGQDFVRDNLCVFGLENPLALRAGDQLELILAMKECGKVMVRAQSGEIVNLGARCDIEKLGFSPPVLSFQLVNLLSINQMIHLEITERKEKETALYLNGESWGLVGAEPLPILLQTSPIRQADYEWLHFMQSACDRATVRLSEIGERKELKNRLWSLQAAIKQAVEADTVLRGLRVDVVESEDQRVRIPNFKPVKPEESLKWLTRAREEMRGFQKDLGKLSQDPILASDLQGLIIPLALSVTPGEIGGGSVPFTVTAQVRNPLRIPATMRVELNLPEGWNALAKEEVAFDDRKTPVEERQIHFTVTPNTSLWEHRYDLSVLLSGTWENFPFRRSQPLAVGHQFVTEWLTIGPFPNRRGEGFNQMYPPEIDIKPAETYDGIGKIVGWQKQKFPSGYVDMKQIFSPNDFAVGYAYIGVYSSREQAVRFEFGSDEGIKIFHNYKEVYAKRQLRSPRPGADRVLLKLYEGWNHILVKVSQSSGPWGFYFEITDLNGRNISELKYALDRM